jgi:hypothetical protein
MLIPIKYPDNRLDYVKDTALDYLIESNKIIEFKRSSGWVRIGVDEIRNSKRSYTV